MKRRELENALKAIGWWFSHDGGEHAFWTNGHHYVQVPRHRELNEYTARGIIKQAKKKGTNQ